MTENRLKIKFHLFQRKQRIVSRDSAVFKHLKNENVIARYYYCNTETSGRRGTEVTWFEFWLLSVSFVMTLVFRSDSHIFTHV